MESATRLSLHSSRTTSVAFSDDDEDHDNLHHSASISGIVIEGPTIKVLSSKASISDSINKLSIAEQIRKNLDKKNQNRPDVDQMKPDRPNPTFDIPEQEEGNRPGAPRRKSLLEYVEGDMAKTGQKSNLFRFLAVGTHEEDPQEFMNLHEKIIEVVNIACYDEPATGYLIIYPKHFTHLIEGSELTINKYIGICAELFQGHTQSHIETDYHARADKTYTVRMVIVNYVIARERYTSEWYHVIHLTPSHRSLKHYRGFRKRLYEFIKRIWVLAGVLADSYAKEPIIYSDDPLEAALELMEEKELYRQIQEKLHTLFPSIELLNYLLKSKKRVPPLRTPVEHIEKYWTVPNIILDSEVTWPVPCRLAPYH